MDLQLQKLAFTTHMVQQVIRADARVDPTELEFMHHTFPNQLLQRCGFVGDDGEMTPRYVEARDSALLELPDRLTQGEKLALIEVLVEASAADGEIGAEEVDVLHAAARMLHLADGAWADHLQALVDSGRVRRDACGI